MFGNLDRILYEIRFIFQLAINVEIRIHCIQKIDDLSKKTDNFQMWLFHQNY